MGSSLSTCETPAELTESQRFRVVTIAESFLGTPYHHMGRIKGVGVDCLTLLAQVYHEAGLIPDLDIPFYPKDFMQHRDVERYLNGLLQYTHEVEIPLPGDIALWKFGRCFSHAAIVVQWPVVIHACAGRCCMIEDAMAAAYLTHIGENVSDRGKPRPRRFFSYWS